MMYGKVEIPIHPIEKFIKLYQITVGVHRVKLQIKIPSLCPILILAKASCWALVMAVDQHLVILKRIDRASVEELGEGVFFMSANHLRVQCCCTIIKPTLS